LPGRLKVAQHAVLGSFENMLSPVGTAEFILGWDLPQPSLRDCFAKPVAHPRTAIPRRCYRFDGVRNRQRALSMRPSCRRAGGIEWQPSPLIPVSTRKPRSFSRGKHRMLIDGRFVHSCIRQDLPRITIPPPAKRWPRVPEAEAEDVDRAVAPRAAAFDSGPVEPDDTPSPRGTA